MARDTLTINEITSKGSPKAEDVSGTAFVAANDQQFINDGNTILLIKNAGTSGDQDVTLVSVSDQFGRTGDVTVTTGQGDESICGPFPPSLWNQSDGYMHIDGSDEDNLTIFAISLKR